MRSVHGYFGGVSNALSECVELKAYYQESVSTAVKVHKYIPEEKAHGKQHKVGG